MVRQQWRGAGRGRTVAAVAGWSCWPSRRPTAAPADGWRRSGTASRSRPRPRCPGRGPPPPTTAAPDAFPRFLPRGGRPAAAGPPPRVHARGEATLLHSPLWRQAEADAAAAGQPGRDFLAADREHPPPGRGRRPRRSPPGDAARPARSPSPGTRRSRSRRRRRRPWRTPATTPAPRPPTTPTTRAPAGSTARSPASTPSGSTTRARRATRPRPRPSRSWTPARRARVLLSYTYGFNGYTAERRDVALQPDRGVPILADAGRARQAGRRRRRRGAALGQRVRARADRPAGRPRPARSPARHRPAARPPRPRRPAARARSATSGSPTAWATSSPPTRTPGAANHEGLLVRYTFTQAGGRDGAWRVSAAEYAPLLMVRDRTPTRLVDVARALRPGDPGHAADFRLELARDRTAGVVMSCGPARRP